MEALTAEAEDARSARLRYVDDSMPGFRRERTGATFAYFDQHGKKIVDEAELGRIRGLAIPPAYEHVWICPIANGHVQATARDARGRKQYRYHKRWREVRDASKFESTIAFARALPALRARVATDLAKGGASRDTVLASVVAMLEATLVRVGNETYARENGSYGLTTLRSRHVRIEGDKRIRLRFRGKSGVEHAVTIEDRRVARTIRRCRDLEGEALFRYVDDAGETHEVVSDDVNAYIREATAGDFSAKDFRTWSATVICALALQALGPAETVADAKRNVTAALATTAKRLGNTPAVCRKAYVHPSVIEAYLDERELVLPRAGSRSKAPGLDGDERRVLAFLERAGRADARRRDLGLLKASVRAAKRRRNAA
jgi:DNA topoisomerase-1